MPEISHYFIRYLIGITLTSSFPAILAASPTVVKVGVILTQGSNLPYDYNILAPALEAAYEKSLTEYNVRFEPVLCLYQGGCSVSNAAGQTFIAANKSVDFIIGKSEQNQP